MSEQNKIQLFENQPIRTAWNEEQEEWYFSVVDVIHVLTGSENPRRYWSDLKRKLKSEGATQLYENIVQLEKGREFAILTDEITRTWSGMTTRQYKNLKGLKKENLRDNMSDTELVLTMLAEASTRDISKASKPEGFFGSMEVARQGGEVAGVARKALEERTGAPVITAQNAAQMNTLVVGMIEEAATLPAQAEADDKE